YQIIYIDQPHSWRVIKSDDSGDFEEEAFHIHGILCGSDLPPIQSKDIAKLKTKATYIRQVARLTGLSTPTFGSTVNNIGNIYNLMSSYIGNNILSSWQAASYKGHEAIDTNARYFTPRKHVPQEHGQAFEIGVDSDGVLANIRGQHLIHGHDNKVDYLREYKDRNRNTKLVRVESGKFKIGDIVRATVSFVAFPSKDKRATMTIVLKALTLIE
ncbi:hypothetical protein BDZ97DRAFT_1613294, partial [Flammula alnicola]